MTYVDHGAKGCLALCCRQVHLDQLIKLAGVVTRRTGVFPQLQEVKFNCTKCGYVLGPFYQNTEKETAPNTCNQCQSKGPFEVSRTRQTQVKATLEVLRSYGMGIIYMRPRWLC